MIKKSFRMPTTSLRYPPTSGPAREPARLKDAIIPRAQPVWFCGVSDAISVTDAE